MKHDRQHTQVAIIGGGAAGMATVIWCADLGLEAAIFEQRPVIGGQMHYIFNAIRNYPGFDEIGSPALLERFTRQVEATGLDVMTRTVVKAFNADSRCLVLGDERTITADHVVIATGVSRRKIDARGIYELPGNILLESGAKQKDLVAGRSVLIVGGGDAAFENAVVLSGKAREVSVIHRGGRFSARPEFVREVDKAANVRVMTHTIVESAEPTGDGTAVVRLKSRGRSIEIEVDHVLVRVGVEPNTSVFGGQVALDHRGYIVVDHSCRTDRRAVYAVGDVAFPISPTLSTAVGSASIAAKTIANLVSKP